MDRPTVEYIDQVLNADSITIAAGLVTITVGRYVAIYHEGTTALQYRYFMVKMPSYDW